MMRLRRPLAALSALVLLLGATPGCVSLRYDEPAPAREALAPDAAGSEPDSARSTTPTRARLEAQRARGADAETPKSWRELTRLARERVQTGELDQARDLLEQAALALADQRPTSTRRRTVFGLRARLAGDFAAAGQLDAADALADQLFEEAGREPELGDSALVSLAYTTALRRSEAARTDGRTDPQLPLLALALDTAARDTASRERLALAFQVSGLALRNGDLDLARRAIEQARADARLIAPGDAMQAAALEVYAARIALAQHDFAAAEGSAEAALRGFEAIGADASNLGVAEITLARVVAEQGGLERALELARRAYARTSEGAPLAPHARRQIAAGLARVETLAGDHRSANAHYREALLDPSDGSALDDDLIRSVKDALAELEAGPPGTASR